MKGTTTDMSYTLLPDDHAQEKQDKLDLDLFKRVSRQTCKNMEQTYKLLNKGANPMRFDGELIDFTFRHSGYAANCFEFFTHCYENYQEVKDYVHDKLDLNSTLREPVRHLDALVFLITRTERNLNEQERESLNNPAKNHAESNAEAIKAVNHALCKRDLHDRMKSQQQARPVKKAQQQTMKI